MLEKKWRFRGADRRAAVLGMLGGCIDEELRMFVELLLRPMGSSSSVCRDGVFTFAWCPRLLLKSSRVGRCGEEPWTAAFRIGMRLGASSTTKVNLSIPEDVDETYVDALGDVEEGRLTFKRPRLPTSLPICQCSIALLICGDLSSHSSPGPLTSIEKTSKHHRHCWIFAMCGPQSTSIYGFWLFMTSRTLPQMYNSLVATNVKPAVVLRIFEWWIG
jgi:U3 small nucleolar RNA-associated protein 20